MGKQPFGKTKGGQAYPKKKYNKKITNLKNDYDDNHEDRIGRTLPRRRNDSRFDEVEQSHQYYDKLIKMDRISLKSELQTLQSRVREIESIEDTYQKYSNLTKDERIKLETEKEQTMKKLRILNRQMEKSNLFKAKSIGTSFSSSEDELRTIVKDIEDIENDKIRWSFRSNPEKNELLKQKETALDQLELIEKNMKKGDKALLEKSLSQLKQEGTNPKTQMKRGRIFDVKVTDVKQIEKMTVGELGRQLGHTGKSKTDVDREAIILETMLKKMKMNKKVQDIDSEFILDQMNINEKHVTANEKKMLERAMDSTHNDTKTKNVKSFEDVHDEHLNKQDERATAQLVEALSRARTKTRNDSGISPAKIFEVNTDGTSAFEKMLDGSLERARKDPKLLDAHIKRLEREQSWTYDRTVADPKNEFEYSQAWARLHGALSKARKVRGY